MSVEILGSCSCRKIPDQIWWIFKSLSVFVQLIPTWLILYQFSIFHFLDFFLFLQERQFLVASILLEFIISLIYYGIRDIYLSEFNPSTLFLALFIRSQLTNTITLGLIFLPKLWYQHKQVNFSSWMSWFNDMFDIIITFIRFYLYLISLFFWCENFFI